MLVNCGMNFVFVPRNTIVEPEAGEERNDGMISGNNKRRRRRRLSLADDVVSRYRVFSCESYSYAIVAPR